MTPARQLLQLAPILGRIRRIDHWVVAKGSSPMHRTSAMTDALLTNHIVGATRVGACPMERGSSTTRLALLDLDDHDKEMKWTQVQDIASKIIDNGRMLEVEFIPFRSSGGRGMHLYAIWDEPQDARSVRAHLSTVLSSIGYSNGTKGLQAKQVEVFPKQDSVPADGWGNMFVLPCGGNTESVPLHPDTLQVIHLADTEWPVSTPVPHAPAPERPLVVVEPGSADISRIRSALMHLDPNEFDYDQWIRLVMAVSHGTGGSAAGHALIHEWSSQFARYDPVETDKQWNWATPDKAGGITVNTLFAAARKREWLDPVQAPNADGFEVVADEPPPGTDDLGAPMVGRGKVDGIISNVTPAVARPDIVGYHLAFDEFGAEIVVDTEGTGAWRPIRDRDYVAMRVALERRGFKSVGREVIRDAVVSTAEANPIDTGKMWLEGLPAWDGVPRIERFFIDRFGVADTEYSRAVGAYTWTAMAGRVMDPGCQVDMVPVLTGMQGARKTQTIKAMLPSQQFYAEVDLARRDSDQARLLRGKLLGEIAELRGLATRDMESIKAFITRQYEEWTIKFREDNMRYPRRCIFIGTTNSDRFLADETGNRRWLPLRVTRRDGRGIATDRDQLWAEGLARWREHGVEFERAEELATIEHDDYMIDDPWEEPIKDYMEDVGRAVSAAEIRSQVLRIDVARDDHRIKNRIAKCFRRLGCIGPRDGRTPFEPNRVRKLWRLPDRPPAPTLEDLL